MSSESASPLQVTFTPEFKRNLRQLAKKYRHIQSDLQPVIDQLVSGSKPGDQVPGVRYEALGSDTEGPICNKRSSLT
jgi:mRNA-degrading endonuclease RelE of RelBE toxin-antitoxin system